MSARFARLLYQPCIPLGKNGSCITACKEHTELSRKAASEGVVMLKNEDAVLPLKKGERVALFGNGTIEYIKGGGGSGEVNSPYTRNIYDGFSIKQKEGKVQIFEPLCDFYRKHLSECDQHYSADKHGVYHTAEPEIPAELIKEASDFADTAIITISRFSCEGWDRSPNEGDFLLDSAEQKIVEDVSIAFNKVIVVLNVSGPVDTNWCKNNSKISSVLYAGLGGMEGGLAIADIICGDVNPSGKLVDTLAVNLEDYPSSNGFNESDEYVNYTEDIYVGYRYFETIPNAKEKVNYPFGFGLSYTKFKIDGLYGFDNGENITFTATVTNTGTVAGKEVVQIYCEAPQGLLGKAARSLIAFKKTKLLEPGESETVAMRVKISDLASYDDLGKISKAAYILEKGEYLFHIGTSVRDTAELDYRYIVNENTVIKQLETRCAPNKLEKRMISDGTYEELPSFPLKEHTTSNPENSAVAPENDVMFEAVGEQITLDEFIAQLTDDELVEQIGGHDAPGGMNCAGSMGGLNRLKIPYTTAADGPAGLRTSLEHGIFPTAWPGETVLATTWNTDIVYQIGVAGALEVRENNIGIWLAPGINIHRNPMCGRNFEYYSEDPLISGKMSAAMVKGMQSQKISPAVKHLVCNNKEVNRSNSDSRVSERALREIYLKGFEICVTEANPWMIMTSYNILNGCYTSECYDLLTGIFRNEWGYKGMFTSDWANSADHVSEVKAGNDIKMYGQPEKIKEALKSGDLTRADIETCAKRVLQMILNLD